MSIIKSEECANLMKIYEPYKYSDMALVLFVLHK